MPVSLGCMYIDRLIGNKAETELGKGDKGYLSIGSRYSSCIDHMNGADFDLI